MNPQVDERIYWPDDSPIAACATHDIDRLFDAKMRAYQILQNIRRLKLGNAARCLTKDPMSISKIVELDRKLGIKSTIFLMAKEYEIAHEEVWDATDRGFEIGLHGSYESHLDKWKLAEEKVTLARKAKIRIKDIRGIRQHYLRFKEPDTWIAQRGLFLYDSTYAWPDHIGYRNGKAYPFYTGYEMWEIPLAVMDVTVFNVQRIGWNQIKLLIDRVEKKGGLFTYLWHNESLTEISATRPWLKMYTKITEYLKEKKAWFGTGSEIVEWTDQLF